MVVMRLATITNWAYGATVALTLVSGATMILASNAQQREREAVEKRYRLDKATEKLGTEIYLLTDQARQYVDIGDPTYKVIYEGNLDTLGTVEERIRLIEQSGTTREEVDIVEKAIRLADTLHDEQDAALAAFRQGEEAKARRILFGSEYERQLDRVEALLERFRDRLDNRIQREVDAATNVADLWKTVSEVVLAITGLLFLFVLYFVFKQRVLRPVVKLSDVVSRLAAQDFAVEPPELNQIDEIGDMAHAIRVFRENGLERQRLEAERTTDQEIRDLISRMTQRMQGSDTLSDLLDIVRRFVPEIAPSYAGRLYLLDEKRNAVAEACSWLDPVCSRTEFPPTACWALRRGLPHQPTGKNIDVPCDHLERTPDGRIPDSLCLPLISQREILGLLYFEPCTAGEDKRETPVVYLSMLAENIGLSLGNLRLRDTLREMAMVDPLTGLANRRQLDRVMNAEAVRAEAQDKPLSCLMVDVDHFKRFNDAFGHDAGDAVLRAVGSVLKGATREPELAFRFGGEEFLLLLPGLSPEQAKARGEEIRSRIANLQLMHDGADLGTVTVSIGVASAPEHCSFDRLGQTADAALLHAKARGRDRVEVAKHGSSDSAAKKLTASA